MKKSSVPSLFLVLLSALLAVSSGAFVTQRNGGATSTAFSTFRSPLSSSSSSSYSSYSSSSSSAICMSDMGNVEQIEFRIYPDGRVEETVRGIRGNDCHKVTEKINKELGEVVASKPTEEMYETELVIEQTLQDKVNNNDRIDSSGGWEGSSSW